MLVRVEVYHDGRFWCGRGVGADFFTRARSVDDLIRNVKEAASLHVEAVLEQGESVRLRLIQQGRNR